LGKKEKGMKDLFVRVRAALQSKRREELKGDLRRNLYTSLTSFSHSLQVFHPLGLP